ncbi:thioesterase II family protein [Streptomyces sp. P1-3]|uniref:thioesterase II family protein n=1 Tax=Streptomyces sp. P1-3 TaxID=3421658 RepID=UPI003D359E6C
MTVDSADLAVETPYLWRARRDNPRHRLICFPHAGAGAAAFTAWPSLLPPEIEVAAVQLPGRQNRIAEDPATEVGPLVKVLTQALRPVLTGSFSFFGHSGGAILAFEVAQALHARGGPRPDHLILSGQPAPGQSHTIRHLHELPDDEFATEVLALGGVDEEVAEDEDVMEALLYTLRADFVLWERHRMEPKHRLDTPITVVSGTDDPRAPLASLDAWREQTTAPFQTRLYPGGHFYFVGEREAEVVEFLGSTVQAPELAGRI